MPIEHHHDNNATNDHVLGTVGFVLGFVAIFGTMGVGWPLFILFFVGGWYLRQAGEGLRKYRPAARTSQAVIAILGAFTGILVPFSVYSFWVLFSHRGRTYYEARGRGLDEHAAARHTYRVLEEPYTPPPPRPPAAPRPSAIPVQSMVTSEVREEPRPRRRSRLVSAGFWVLGLTFAAAVLLTAGDVVEPSLGLSRNALPAVVACGLLASAALLALGFLSALLSPRTTGGGAAFAGLCLCGLVGLGAYVAFERAGPLARNWARETCLGRYLSVPPQSFERDFLEQDNGGRYREIERAVGEALPELKLQRREKDQLWIRWPAAVHGPRRVDVARELQRLVREELGDSFQPSRVD
jgi:hypothetical protein